ncbi:MAG: PLDc N-terminal domain-containing protein [Candidatus Woesearchaeota archaeon]
MGIVGTLLWIAGIVCAVWVIYDVWQNQKRMDQTMKIIWTVAAVLLSILTAIVYYFVVKKK